MKHKRRSQAFQPLSANVPPMPGPTIAACAICSLFFEFVVPAKAGTQDIDHPVMLESGFKPASAWSNKYRRLNKGYEYLVDTSEATLVSAMSRISWYL